MEINTANLTSLNSCYWRVIGHSPYSENAKLRHCSSKYTHILRENDIIKVGRIKFLVKHLNVIGKEIEASKKIFSTKTVESREENAADNCRICLDEAQTEENPIVSICNCKGSNSAHYDCLKRWINTSLKAQEISSLMGISYSTSKYNCEICKEPYPSAFLTSNIQTQRKRVSHVRLQRSRRGKFRYSPVTQQCERECLSS